ncbi:MAG: hypothetical protein ACKO38_18835 [Planctomycetota bacterium]
MCLWKVFSASSPITPPLKNRRVPGGTCGQIFGSSHTTLLTVFCDGSVHSISFTIDPNMWLRLCSAQDGMPFTLN